MKAALRVMLTGLALATAAAAPAQAARFWCPVGEVKYLAVTDTGLVYADIGLGVWGICNIANDSMGIPPQVCQTWYSTLLTQRSIGQRIMLYFDTAHPSNSGTDPAVQCRDFGDWTLHVPYHISAAS